MHRTSRTLALIITLAMALTNHGCTSDLGPLVDPAAPFTDSGSGDMSAGNAAPGTQTTDAQDPNDAVRPDSLNTSEAPLNACESGYLVRKRYYDSTPQRTSIVLSVPDNACNENAVSLGAAAEEAKASVVCYERVSGDLVFPLSFHIVPTPGLYRPHVAILLDNAQGLRERSHEEDFKAVVAGTAASVEHLLASGAVIRLYVYKETEADAVVAPLTGFSSDKEEIMAALAEATTLPLVKERDVDAAVSEIARDLGTLPAPACGLAPTFIFAFLTGIATDTPMLPKGLVPLVQEQIAEPAEAPVVVALGLAGNSSEYLFDQALIDAYCGGGSYKNPSPAEGGWGAVFSPEEAGSVLRDTWARAFSPYSGDFAVTACVNYTSPAVGPIEMECHLNVPGNDEPVIVSLQYEAEANESFCAAADPCFGRGPEAGICAGDFLCPARAYDNHSTAEPEAEAPVEGAPCSERSLWACDGAVALACDSGGMWVAMFDCGAVPELEETCVITEPGSPTCMPAAEAAALEPGESISSPPTEAPVATDAPDCEIGTVGCHDGAVSLCESKSSWLPLLDCEGSNRVCVDTDGEGPACLPQE